MPELKDLSLREKRDLLTALLNERRKLYSDYPSYWVEDLGLLRDAAGHPATLDPWQVAFLDSQKKRKILNIHRQGGKSAMASLKCLHKAIFKPGSLSLIIAPSLRQSQENFIAVKKAIELLEEPPSFREFTKLSLQTEENSRILCLPGGNEGTTIRGFSRPDLIVEDESSRCSDELHQAILPMMTAYPECEFIMCSTPWGQRGHFFKTWQANLKDWLKIELRASQNPRISQQFLEEQKNGPNGPLYYAQEFECQFTTPTGAIYPFFTTDPKAGFVISELPDDLLRWRIAIDFGQEHPTTMGLYGHSDKLGCWILVKEYYQTMKTIPQLSADFGSEMLRWDDKEVIPEYVDIDTGGGGLALLNQLRQDYPFLHAQSAIRHAIKINVNSEISRVAAALYSHKFRYYAACKRSIEETQDYRWAESEKEAPLKERDDGPDRDRYFISRLYQSI